jgi:hypothetical protein
MRTLRPVGIEYLGTAPVRATLRRTIPASTAETFRSFEDAASWPVWLDPVESVRWTSPPPFGVGTTRDVRVRGGTLSERFFAWEDGRRIAFHVTDASVPVFGAIAEDYELVPTGEAECVLVWRYGFECRGVFRVVQPLVAMAFRRMATKALGQLADHLRRGRAQYSTA